MKLLLVTVLGFALLACHTVNQDQEGGALATHNPHKQMTIPDSLTNALDLLASEHGADRQQGINWLLQNTRAARPALQKLVLDASTSSWKRAGVLEVLGQMKNGEDVALLVKAAHLYTSNRWDALRALAEYDSAEAQEGLERMAQSKDEAMAAEALVALGLQGNGESRPFLEEQLSSNSVKIRWKAIHAIDLLGVASSQSALEKLLATEANDMVLEKLNQVLQKEN